MYALSSRCLYRASHQLSLTAPIFFFFFCWVQTLLHFRRPVALGGASATEVQPPLTLNGPIELKSY